MPLVRRMRGVQALKGTCTLTLTRKVMRLSSSWSYLPTRAGRKSIIKVTIPALRHSLI